VRRVAAPWAPRWAKPPFRALARAPYPARERAEHPAAQSRARALQAIRLRSAPAAAGNQTAADIHKAADIHIHMDMGTGNQEAHRAALLPAEENPVGPVPAEQARERAQLPAAWQAPERQRAAALLPAFSGPVPAPVARGGARPAREPSKPRPRRSPASPRRSRVDD
jgi:hypothetical protein